MKHRDRKAEPRPRTRELSEDELEQVNGGALNAYMTMTGETQGTVDGTSEDD